MNSAASFTLTPPVALGLFFIQRYRFLSIVQFARASGLSPHRAEDVLRALARKGLLGHFGNVPIPGHGKTPKLYYLTRKGFEFLRRESDIPDEFLGSFVQTHLEASWSPQMYHRLRLLDLLIAVEGQARACPHLNLVKTFLEYRRVKKNGRIARETTDFVSDEETAENRIIPDGAVVLENTERGGRRELLFIEADMGTERIVTQISHDRRLTLRFKIGQYDRYLTGGRFAKTYAAYGEFDHFTLLFVTEGQERVDNIRRALTALSAELAEFYLFTTFEQARGDFLGPIWKSRLLSDGNTYALAYTPSREGREAG
jgi:hypothetical protein